ncbi:MAG: hypothetical protein D6808_03730 [Candidatus Dadabacteria bacterium]|nr:MAG: hypothetical protein D6808_03730 [Candidatus Dadabacteria bacterium]
MGFKIIANITEKAVLRENIITAHIQPFRSSLWALSPIFLIRHSQIFAANFNITFFFYQISFIVVLVEMIVVAWG